MNQTLLSFERLKASSTDGPADASHRSVSCAWVRILLFLRSWNAKKAGARRRRPDAWPWEGNKATSPILAILPKKSLRTASNVEGSLQCSDRRCHVNRCHRSCREGFFAGTGPTSRQQPSDVTWLVAARLGRKRRGDHVHGYGPLSWCGDRTSTLAVSGRIPHRDRLGLWARCRPMVRTFPSFVRFVRFVLLRPGSLHA